MPRRHKHALKIVNAPVILSKYLRAYKAPKNLLTTVILIITVILSAAKNLNPQPASPSNRLTVQL